MMSVSAPWPPKVRTTDVAYNAEGMFAYSQMQNREFDNEAFGFRATRHQAFVGTGYFDAIQTVISGEDTSTTAMAGSTETEQFEEAKAS